MSLLSAYLRRQYKLLLLLLGFFVIFAAVFSLYDLPGEAVAYAAALCLALGLALFAVGYSRFLARHRELRLLLRQAREKVLPLPPPGAFWRRTIRPWSRPSARTGPIWLRRTRTACGT